MGRRVILDTNVLIDLERGADIPSLRDSDKAAIAAVTLAELRTGLELAQSRSQKERREQLISDTQGWAEIIDYTERTAAHHARLIAHVKRTVRPRGALDLIIAAHALETGRILISRDAAARFGDLTGVIAEEP